MSTVSSGTLNAVAVINTAISSFLIKVKLQVIKSQLVALSRSQETQLSLTGHAQHHITILPVKYDNRK